MTTIVDRNRPGFIPLFHAAVLAAALSQFLGALLPTCVLGQLPDRLESNCASWAADRRNVLLSVAIVSSSSRRSAGVVRPATC